MIQKHKSLLLVLAAEAALLPLLCWAGFGQSAWITSIVAFPFEQICLGLRWLSFSGPAGNIVAIVLYAVLSLLPLAAYFRLRKAGKSTGADALLLLLTILLFLVFYWMINPGLFLDAIGGQLAGGLNMVLGGCVYAVLFAWIVLRFVARFPQADRDQLQGYISLLLKVLAVVFVFDAFGVGFESFLSQLDALRTSNTDGSLTLSYGFLFLRWLAAAVPCLLAIAVILAALDLLAQRRSDPYSHETIAAADHLARRCITCLSVSVLVPLAVELLQLCFLGTLHIVHVTVELPVISVAFVLCILLLARLMGENKSLKDDNDLFI